MIKIQKKNNNIKYKLGNFEANYTRNHPNFKGKELYEAYINDNNNKKELKNILLNEQNALCCYCMGKISEDKMNIEHFKPKDKYKYKALNYSNLLASCRTEGQCDNNKGNKELIEFFNPADNSKNIENLISYNLQGEIIINNEYIIRNKYSQNKITQLMTEINNILNLNNKNLIRNRKTKCTVIIRNSINDKKKIKRLLDTKGIAYYGYINFCINNNN